MDHSHHGHHMDMDQPMCNMNMLFTWDTNNLCIIFHSWRITGIVSLLVSLAGVAALTAGYEYIRELSRRYEERTTAGSAAKGGISLPRRDSAVTAGSTPRGQKVVKATFYAVQVFYSFFIMLLFMTYNGWVMLAVAAGAFAGYLIWGGSSATKSVACH